MELFAEYVAKTLGVKLPDGYVRFMEKYGRKLPADPVNQESWVSGLGDSAFVVGTTQAFRAEIPHFSMENVVIGYSGIKTIVINKVYETVDTYVMLNTRDGRVLSVDSLGAVEAIAEGFDEWIGAELHRAELREKYDSTLTVVLFDDVLKAEEARATMAKLQRRGHIDIEDAVVVVKEADGTTKYRQTHKMTKKGAALGSAVGLVVGALLALPLLGGVLGAVTGAVSAALEDTGIEDNFIKELASHFKPGSSALFILVRKSQPYKVLDACRGFGGKVLATSVSKEKAAMLQACLDDARQKADQNRG